MHQHSITQQNAEAPRHMIAFMSIIVVYALTAID